MGTGFYGMLKYIRNIILRLLLSLHISYKKCHLPATLLRDEAVTNGWMDGWMDGYCLFKEQQLLTISH